jgi:hypothetical protein
MLTANFDGSFEWQLEVEVLVDLSLQMQIYNMSVFRLLNNLVVYANSAFKSKGNALLQFHKTLELETPTLRKDV